MEYKFSKKNTNKNDGVIRVYGKYILRNDSRKSLGVFFFDIVLVNETKNWVNTKLEIWWDTLESKCSRLSMIKAYYMEYNFSKKNI